MSIDLKDAYLHIPVHPQSRRFLGFQFMDLTYQYEVLPFGLKDSPWVFTRVVATLVGHLRRLGLRVFYYLDDWLLIAESKELLELHLQTTLQWTQDLGFLVNWKKSSLTPQRIPSYLGAQLDIPNLLARPLEHRVLALQGVIRDLTGGCLATALLWQKFLGHLASFVDLVPNCRMLMRPLQLHFLRFFTPLVDPQDKLIPLSPEIKVLCRAWASPSRLLEGKPFAPPPHSLVVTTDASLLGWGAVLHPHRVSGVWSKKEALDHINSLELKAVFLALQNLESRVLGHSVLIRSDNMTVVSFINHQGGTHSSSLCRLALDLWEWCLQRKIFLQAAHIPGEENIVADFLSRGKYRSPFRVGSESLRFSEDLSCVVSSSGDRLVRFGAQLPAAEVLLPVSGCSGVEDRRVVVSLDGSSSVRVSSFLSSPQDLGQGCPGRSGSSPGRSVLASEALVSASTSALGRSSKSVASSQGPSGTTPVFDASSQSRKSSSFSMASLRQQGEDAGLSQRAAQFSAEAFRQSTRDTYDSRLVPFREWCAKIPCDPTTASLGVVADFLMSRFDKGLALATLRSFRSAIASCHRGFCDGSTVTDSRFLTRLMKSFFLKRPPPKTLIPAWSLPAVLQVLASAPFEPLHKASLRLLTLKDGVLSGHRLGPQGQFIAGPLCRSWTFTLGSLWCPVDS